MASSRVSWLINFTSQVGLKWGNSSALTNIQRFRPKHISIPGPFTSLGATTKFVCDHWIKSVIIKTSFSSQLPKAINLPILTSPYPHLPSNPFLLNF